MPTPATEHDSQANLRRRALQQLTGRNVQDGALPSPSAALRTLYELASSPSTAADALALLHELQVHQVELDLQGEELRGARIELEASLRRQIQLYDFAPVGLFTLDGNTTLSELNLTGARLLGMERDAVLGQRLDGYLSPQGRDTLRALLTRVGEGHKEGCTLQLKSPDGGQRVVRAWAGIDPAGRFLVALSDIRGEGPMEP